MDRIHKLIITLVKICSYYGVRYILNGGVQDILSRVKIRTGEKVGNINTHFFCRDWAEVALVTKIYLLWSAQGKHAFPFEWVSNWTRQGVPVEAEPPPTLFPYSWFTLIILQPKSFQRKWTFVTRTKQPMIFNRPGVAGAVL